jgi:amino acid transporter
MTLTSWACFILVVFGIVLFLYGANAYNAPVGWVGVYLFLAGVITFLVLYIYGELTKKSPQKP